MLVKAVINLATLEVVALKLTAQQIFQLFFDHLNCLELEWPQHHCHFEQKNSLYHYYNFYYPDKGFKLLTKILHRTIQKIFTSIYKNVAQG